MEILVDLLEVIAALIKRNKFRLAIIVAVVILIIVVVFRDYLFGN